VVDLCEVFQMMDRTDRNMLGMNHRIFRISFFLFLNNQPDLLIIQIYCYKTLHVSGIFSAHHQEFSTIHFALVSFMQVLMTASKQSQDVSGNSILTLLGSGHQKPV